MGTISEAVKAMAEIEGNFSKEVLEAMTDSRSVVREVIQEQLASGLNGREKPLRPTYLNDPYFKDKDSPWYGRAKQYMEWKRRITPPARSWLGFPARDIRTPNLFITGVYYDSIQASKGNNGLRIESMDSTMGGDIERKYGSIILGVGNTGKKFLIEYHILPHLRSWLRKFGIK